MLKRARSSIPCCRATPIRGDPRRRFQRRALLHPEPHLESALSDAWTDLGVRPGARTSWPATGWAGTRATSSSTFSCTTPAAACSRSRRDPQPQPGPLRPSPRRLHDALDRSHPDLSAAGFRGRCHLRRHDAGSALRPRGGRRGLGSHPLRDFPRGAGRRRSPRAARARGAARHGTPGV